MINRITDFRKLIENKDRLIDRLDFPQEKKQALKDFFNKHPNYESKIDWNRRDLSWKDFESLLALEGKSASQAKRNGLAGLTEGIDYNIIYQNNEGILFEVLTHLASRVLASSKVGDGHQTATWCISMNRANYWRQYRANGTQFFFWIRTWAKGTRGQLSRYNKIALAFNRRSLLYQCKRSRTVPSPTYIISNWIHYFDVEDRQTLWQVVNEDFPIAKVLAPYITVTQEEIDNLQREEDLATLRSLTVPGEAQNFGFGYSFTHPTKDSLYVKILKMIQENGPMTKREILIELTNRKEMPLRTETWKGEYDPETRRYSGRYIPIDPNSYWKNSKNTVSGQYSSLFGALRSANLLSYNQDTKKWALGPNFSPYAAHYRSVFN